MLDIMFWLIIYLIVTTAISVYMNTDMIVNDYYSDKEVAATILECVLFFPLLACLSVLLVVYSAFDYVRELDYLSSVGKLIRRSVKFIEVYL